MSLSIALRKALKDNEPKLKASLDKIKTALGLEVTIEADWAELVKAAQAFPGINQGSRTFEVAMVEWTQNDLLQAITSLIETSCKDELLKQGIVENLTAKKIVFKIDAKPDEKANSFASMHSLFFADGTLVVTSKQADRIPSNLSDVTSFNLVRILHAPTGQLSFSIRKSLKEFEPKKTAALERIKKAAGFDVTIEADWESFVQNAKEKSPGLQGPRRSYEQAAVGFVLNEYLDSLTQLIEKSCKDEILKEGFAEKCTAKKILFKIDATPDVKALGYCGPHSLSFDNGTFVCSFKNVESCAANLGEVQNYKLEKIL